MTAARRPDLMLVAVLAGVALVFVRGLAGGLVYDDLALVQRNPALKNPLDLGALLLGPLYGVEQGYWRPLTSLFLAWGNALGGPAALHGLALVFHLAVVVQVAGLGRDLGLTGRAALWGAFLFGVHPVVVEPVAWIASINDPLWALCGLTAVRAHLSWRRGGSEGLPWRAIIWFAVALLAKENGLSTGLLFVAADIVVATPARQRGSRALRAYASYAFVALAWFAARAFVLGDAAIGAEVAVPLADPVLRRIEVGGRLLLALLVPLDPTPFTAPTPTLALGSLGFVAPLLSLSILAVLLAVAVARGWRPVAFAGLAFVAVASLAVVRLDALGPYPVADRYLYVAVAALALAIAWSVDRLPAPASAVLLAICVSGCGIWSFVRVGIWKDQETLVAAGLTRHPEDPRLHYMRGQLRLERFAATGDAAALDAANGQFRTAQHLLGTPPWNGAAADNPLRVDIELGLAWCGLAAAGADPWPRWQTIIADFERIASAHPRLAPAQVGLGVALASAGRPREARVAFERAVEIDPLLFEARINLARALHMLGDTDGARRALRIALQLRPHDPAALALRDDLDR